MNANRIQNIVIRIVEKQSISVEDVTDLQNAVEEGGFITREEKADALFRAERMAPVACASWSVFFIEGAHRPCRVGAPADGADHRGRCRLALPDHRTSALRHWWRISGRCSFPCCARRWTPTNSSSPWRWRRTTTPRACPPRATRGARFVPQPELHLHHSASGRPSGFSLETTDNHPVGTGHVRQDFPDRQPRRDRLPRHQDRAPDGHQDGGGLFRGRRRRAACRDGRRGRAHRPAAGGRDPTSLIDKIIAACRDRRGGRASGLRLPVRARGVRPRAGRRPASSSSAPTPAPSRRWATRSNRRSSPPRPASPPSPATSARSTTPTHAVQIAEEIGYPVMIKASAGGGGKGMRIA